MVNLKWMDIIRDGYWNQKKTGEIMIELIKYGNEEEKRISLELRP